MQNSKEKLYFFFRKIGLKIFFTQKWSILLKTEIKIGNPTTFSNLVFCSVVFKSFTQNFSSCWASWRHRIKKSCHQILEILGVMSRQGIFFRPSQHLPRRPKKVFRFAVKWNQSSEAPNVSWKRVISKFSKNLKMKD